MNNYLQDLVKHKERIKAYKVTEVRTNKPVQASNQLLRKEKRND